MPHPSLTAAEAERLECLAEECGEVIQAITKIQRHGYLSHNPDVPVDGNNRDHLEKELGDLEGIMNLMIRRGDLNASSVAHHALYKVPRARPYLHHQDLGDYEG